MAKEKKKLTEEQKKQIAKTKRINKEIRRLMGIFKNLSEGVVSLVDGLIKQAAYMRIQLEDYATDLDQGGYVEMFTQSLNTPPYERERPVARLYATANRNYQQIMKQLSDLLPKEDKSKVVEADDGFNAFVQAKQIRK